MPVPTNADATLSSVTSGIAAAQTAYMDANGCYQQAIFWAASDPADGGTSAVDGSRKPTDQAEDWTDLGISVPATADVNVAVHVLRGPSGCGYWIEGRYTDAGSTYSKGVDGVMPAGESRAYDWVDVTSGI